MPNRIPRDPVRIYINNLRDEYYNTVALCYECKRFEPSCDQCFRDDEFRISFDERSSGWLVSRLFGKCGKDGRYYSKEGY